MSLLPPDPTPSEILRENLAGDAEPAPSPGRKRRGRPPGSANTPTEPTEPTFDATAALVRINERLDDLLVRVNALCNTPIPTSTPEPSVLERIAVALESLAGGRIILAPSPAGSPDVMVTPIATEPAKTQRVKAPAPAPVETATPPAAAPPVEDVRAAAVAFVEKWGRDVLVGILAKHSTSGKLSDLRDPAAFLLALKAYEQKAGA